MKKSRIFAGMLSAVLAAGMMSASAFATEPPVDEPVAPGGNYTTPTVESDKSSTTITKYLIMDAEAYAPKVTMTYTLAPGTAAAAESADDYNVYAGIMTGVKYNSDTALTSETAAETTISFTNESTKLNDDEASGLYGSFDEDTQMYVTDSFNIDFSGVAFPEPGIYRYTLTEADNRAEVTALDNAERTLDVFIVDSSVDGGFVTANKKLAISSIVVYSDVVTAKAKAAITTAADTKSAAFNNEYTSHDLTLSKTVTGNQGSKDKYFKFTVAITGAGDSTKLDVVLANADGALNTDASINSALQGISNPATLTTSSAGAVTQDFYLIHGQSIVINGLPDGAKYTITETVGEYTASAEVAGDADAAADDEIATNGIVSDTDTGIKADTTVAYTNNKEGTIPTGVILSIAAPVAIGVAIVAGIIILSVKKKRSESEE